MAIRKELLAVSARLQELSELMRELMATADGVRTLSENLATDLVELAESGRERAERPRPHRRGPKADGTLFHDGRTLRELRLEAGLTQSQLGLLVGRSGNTVSAWERDGPEGVSLRLRNRIVEVCERRREALGDRQEDA